MQAIVADRDGDPDVLRPAEVPDPLAGPGEVVLAVAATAVNKADTLQRRGYYPPPPGESEIIGLECSGTVLSVGDGVTGWQVGDRACALLAGGGYAERVAVPVGQLMPIPAGIDLTTAACLPEVACTVWSNVFGTARLGPGESLLVHGGGGGIGTFAIQLAAALGHRVFTTAGSREKLATCARLGAEVTIDYRTQDFVAEVRAATDGAGVDVILDVMGASYLQRNVDALAIGGRLAIIGLQGGLKGELNVGKLLAKRGTIHATSLRPRPRAEKAAICAEVIDRVWPLVASGSIVPVVHAVLPLAEAAQAHRMVEASSHTGKILLTV